MWALHEEEMDLSTHSSGEKATAFESEKSSSLYFELILTNVSSLNVVGNLIYFQQEWIKKKIKSFLILHTSLMIL